MTRGFSCCVFLYKLPILLDINCKFPSAEAIKMNTNVLVEAKNLFLICMIIISYTKNGAKVQFNRLVLSISKPVTESQRRSDGWQSFWTHLKKIFQTYVDDKKFVLSRSGHLIKASNKIMSIAFLGFEGFLYAKIWVDFYTDLILKKKII